MSKTEMTEARRAAILDRVMTFAIESNACPDLHWYPGVAERGCEDVPTVSANWNNRDHYNAKTKSREVRTHADTIPSRLARIIEDRLGVNIEWCDEWTACDDCGKAVRTQPDSFCWTPSYVMDGDDSCDLFCLDCAAANVEEVSA